MVANPMQKKARNSFLLGMIITLIVCLIIFVLLYVLVIDKAKKEEEELGKKVLAYTLAQDVKSGDVVTKDLLIEKEVYETMIPANYIDETQFYQMELQDEYGNVLYTDSQGDLYIEKDNKKYVTVTNNPDTKIEVKEDKDGFYKVSNDGSKDYVSNPQVYIEGDKKYIIETKVLAVKDDEQGTYYLIKTNGGRENIPENVAIKQQNDEAYIVLQNNVIYKPTQTDSNRILIKQDSEGVFYKTKIDGEMETIKFDRVPCIAKIDMYQNTVITSDLFSKGQIITDDVRHVEYNMLVLPTTIDEGDYIDIRLMLPNGQDLVVASKKEVKSILGDTIALELTEGEILMMDSAIVEAYIMTASKLYAIKYVEPGNQGAAKKTYTPTQEVQDLIDKDSNIVPVAKSYLKGRFDSEIRIDIDEEKVQYSMGEQQNIEEGLKEEIENAKKAREAYLSGLTSY